MDNAKTAQIIIYFRSNENKQPETDEVLRPPERDVQTVRVEQTAPDQGGENRDQTAELRETAVHVFAAVPQLRVEQRRRVRGAS